MDYIAKNLKKVRQRIRAAEKSAARPPGSVSLLAVSKTKPVDALRSAFAAGQTRFGESYVQEAIGKIETLGRQGLEWHFIGPIQSNKTRQIATCFDWVHSVDREKIARRLSEQRPVDMPDLNVCLQVNVSAEASKSGVAFADLEALARAVAGLPRLRLRGLMAIPQATDDVILQRATFHQLAEALRELNTKLGLQLDTLSMGMSDDLEAAIKEGATIVRVGTDIFGERQ